MLRKSPVSIVRCTSYELELVCEAVREAVDMVAGSTDMLREGSTVLLKPNLLSAWDPPERAVNTHPTIVHAVAEYCISRGCKVKIGDSCGSLTPGSTRRAMEVTRLPQVAEETGAELVNLDQAARVRVSVDGGAVLNEVLVSQEYFTADFVVSLPKLKTHGLTMMTGAVKNQFGLVPGRLKKQIHLAAPKPTDMARALVDVFSVVRPDLAIMDGIVGMEGNGPAAGDAKSMGFILAADDAVALDAVAARIMGFSPLEIPTTAEAADRDLGAGQLDDIQLHGLELAQASARDFRPPSRKAMSAAVRLLPTGLFRWAFEQFGKGWPSIDENRCTLCGECVANCPAGALERKDGRILVRRDHCIACYCCTEVCRQRAVDLRVPPWQRALRSLTGGSARQKA